VVEECCEFECNSDCSAYKSSKACNYAGAGFRCGELASFLIVEQSLVFLIIKLLIEAIDCNSVFQLSSVRGLVLCYSRGCFYEESSFAYGVR